MNMIAELENAKRPSACWPSATIPTSSPATPCASTCRSRKASASASRPMKASASPAPAAALQENFTVRKISFGEGVERVFPVMSPMIESIEVKRRGAVRRAKLYYLRDRRGKSARIAERQMSTAAREERRRRKPRGRRESGDPGFFVRRQGGRRQTLQGRRRAPALFAFRISPSGARPVCVSDLPPEGGDRPRSGQRGAHAAPRVRKAL